MPIHSATSRPTPDEILRSLEEDVPLFHSVPPEAVGLLAEAGFHVQPGDYSWAVGSAVLRWIANYVGPEMLTVETGAGHTTVVLAALAGHHYCHTVAETEARRIGEYLDRLGVSRDRVTFTIGSTDQTLPRLAPAAPLDFAYIDGCHGYPFPALDWHYIDRHLKVGGVIGMDNVELRPVREHCRFLEEDGCYELVEGLGDEASGAIVRFYRKVRDENREWICQPYSRAG